MVQSSPLLAFRAAAAVLFAASATWSLGGEPSPQGAGEVDFARDVKPILRARCAECHGPARQKAGLRLDSRDAVLGSSRLAEGAAVVAPGRSAQSELYRRISSLDLEERMPPKGEPLAAEQIELLRRWIDEGAAWPDGGELEAARVHWAYVAPKRPALPAVARPEWVKTPLDAFVLAKLEREGLAPSPEADRATLLRRASLDLTGLPPAPEEVEALLADPSPDAYERAVDRLLASPHYGERWAQLWLDLARYADTNGYEKDDRREMWRWRDWVIEAFNRDLPFDRFTVEQLAGDLLSEPTTDQRLATGFHRNTMINNEGGADPEEFRVAAAVDRVNTTASVWLGTTLACAQCHDHKFDPFSQAEYFRLYAFFDDAADVGNLAEPTMRAPRAEDLARLAEREREVEALERSLGEEWSEDPREERAWERAALEEWGGGAQWRTLELADLRSEAGAVLEQAEDGSVLAGGPASEKDVVTATARPGAGRITALRIEVLRHDSLPAGGPGRAGNGNFVLSLFEAFELAPLDARGTTEGSAGEPVPVEAGAPPAARPLVFQSAEASFEQVQGFRAAGALDRDPDSGWAVNGRAAGESLEAVFVLERPLEAAAGARLELRLHCDSKHGQHVLGRFRVSSTGDLDLWRAARLPAATSWTAAGPLAADSVEAAFQASAPPASVAAAWTPRPEWVDGALHAFAVPPGPSSMFLRRVLDSPRDLEVSLFLGSDDGLRVWLNGELVLERQGARAVQRDQDRVRARLRAGRNELALQVVNVGGPSGFFFDLDRRTGEEPSLAVLAALRRAPAERGDAERGAVEAHYRRAVSPRGRALAAQLAEAEKRRAEADKAVPTAMVMRDLEQGRDTRLHVRGNFLQPGPPVEPGTPSALSPFPEGAPRNRLGLARWIVDSGHPLTARVTVNRFWQQLFGQGLVAVDDDFGSRSDPPTHPELLDWLALELVERGWSVKSLLRTLATSATYRQSSDVGAALLERDPGNTLLARAGRFRLSAEGVRDAALAASGLLSQKLGGPSVFPPQPEGIWNAVYNADRWMVSGGEDRWRRGLYTFLRRTSPYPTFLLFDATSREACCTRRTRSNSPLQALALLNDPAFVEAAVALGGRIVREAGPGARERIERGFRLCLARSPSEAERSAMEELVRREGERFARDPSAAAALLGSCPGEAAEAGPLPEGSFDGPAAAVERATWAAAGSVLLNLDEFVTRN